MLKASLSKLQNTEGQQFYLFNVDQEEIRFSIPLNSEELMILESCICGCLYQGVEDITLEFCNVRSDKKRGYIYVSFITHVPMMSFKLQRSEVTEVYTQISKALEDAGGETG